jgi:simple sugar transport system ATP-binding protein
VHRFSREGAVIVGLVRELKSRGDVSIIIIAHNYSHIVEVCDRVILLQHGRIAPDKPTGETSVEELTRLGGGRTPLCSFCYCE